jgi:hypothetical protein
VEILIGSQHNSTFQTATVAAIEMRPQLRCNTNWSTARCGEAGVGGERPAAVLVGKCLSAARATGSVARGEYGGSADTGVRVPHSMPDVDKDRFLQDVIERTICFCYNA